MKVCVDVQSVLGQRAGVGRYTRNLVEQLGATAASNSLSLFYFDFKRKGTNLALPGVSHHVIRWCPGRLARFAWRILRWPPFNVFCDDADVYHFPNFILPPMKRGKSVVTVHDMSFVRFPQFAERKNERYLSTRIRDTVERADAVITDSHFTADELQSLLKVSRDRIFPVHLGIGNHFKPASPETVTAALAELRIRQPYIITVGTVEPRKNLTFLFEVFEKLAEFDGCLVVAGMAGWKYEPILERMKTSPKAEKIRYIEYVDESLLPALYTGAELFACTSLYEGFGLPPLEAMACGTPVVSSPSGSLKEVLGNAAIMPEEHDPNLWVTQMTKALSDSECRQKLVADGRKRASEYDWTRTARRTWDVYSSLC
jgi:glycosyltransferase involved in cell wall biosynthesis